MKKLILASASPRRLHLLQQIGLKPEVICAHTDEETAEEKPEAMVRELARRKCFSVAAYLTEEVHIRDACYILGADTVVAHGDTILGKPKDTEEASSMLHSLQGDTHQVYTGVCILRLEEDGSLPGADADHLCLFSERTDVSVDAMTEEEIRSYVNTLEPMDKAGAYGIQGIFARHIRGIRGDYNNVVGLPVHAVYAALKELGFYQD